VAVSHIQVRRRSRIRPIETAAQLDRTEMIAQLAFFVVTAAILASRDGIHLLVLRRRGRRGSGFKKKDADVL